MGSLDAQCQRGMAPVELRQRRKQHGAGKKRQRADPEFAAAVAPLPQHVAAGLLQSRQRHRYFRQIALAIRGQAHRSRAADKQLDAEQLLQPANLMADRRRAEGEIARGTAKTQLGGGALEGEQRRQRRYRRPAQWVNLAHLG